MKDKKIDVLCIGDTVTDAFIRLQNAEIHCDIDSTNCKISMPFGAKIPYESSTILYGVGNSANAAVSISRLGLSSGMVTNLGNDEYGEKSKLNFEKEKIDTGLVKLHDGIPTNYHYVLWYKDERTILVKHYPYFRDFNESDLPDCEYVYLSSLGADSLVYHDKIIQWLRHNPKIKLVFQPGTFQMQIGQKAMSPLYMRSHVFVCNVEESKYILETKETDIKKLLMKMHLLGPEIVLITDGPKGAYLYCDKKAYFMPIYPDPAAPYERTGAGDAFASTFTAALAYGLSPVDALTWAPINSMNVVQHVGAQEGLLTKVEIQEFLRNAPKDYFPKEI